LDVGGPNIATAKAGLGRGAGDADGDLDVVLLRIHPDDADGASHGGVVLGTALRPCVLRFAGALIILQPFRSDVDWVVALPFIAGAFYACGVIITRQRCRDESPLALLFANFTAFGLMGGLGAAAMTLYEPSAVQNAAAPFIFSGWTTPPWQAVATMGGLAIGAVLGVGGLTRAYQLADSSFLTLFDYTHVLGACLFAYILWSEVPPPEALLGVVMVVGSGIYIALRGRKV